LSFFILTLPLLIFMKFFFSIGFSISFFLLKNSI
jgi:hypothetical protein